MGPEIARNYLHYSYILTIPISRQNLCATNGVLSDTFHGEDFFYSPEGINIFGDSDLCAQKNVQLCTEKCAMFYRFRSPVVLLKFKRILKSSPDKVIHSKVGFRSEN